MVPSFAVFMVSMTFAGCFGFTTAKENIMDEENIHHIESVDDILTKMVGPPKTPVQADPRKAKYQPSWDSLDSRPLPDWYEEATIGIFIHWGVFSVPGVGPELSEWFWSKSKDNSTDAAKYIEKHEKPGFTYQEFARDFTAEFFNPKQWADIIASSGARYVVLTSKHHDGYTLWPSKYSFGWNSMDVGPHRDLVGQLAFAIKAYHPEIHFGLYHSQFEWFNPLYLQDKEKNFTTNLFVRMKTLPELVELVETYEPEVLWSDGEWDAGAEYWQSREFLAWLYNESPVKDTVVVNDRWCKGCRCKHGGFLTCDDRFVPASLGFKKFENCFTLDKRSWGYRRNINIDDIMDLKTAIETIMNTVSYGGNVLINIGPTKEGTIAPIFQERLKDIGEFLKVNSEAIYGSKPWKTCQHETGEGYSPYVWYTTQRDSDKINLYATFTQWPKNDELNLTCVTVGFERSSIFLLGCDGKDYSPPLTWDAKGKGTIVRLPPQSRTASTKAWTLKIINVEETKGSSQKP